jgi:phosphoglycolate phosphatase
LAYNTFAIARGLSYRNTTLSFPESALQPLVIFDLDGTLLDTAPDLMASLNHVLVSEGIEPVDYGDMSFLVGHGARAMIERAYKLRHQPLDETQTLALLDSFIAHYLAEMPGESRPFPGVERALERLSAAGFSMAVCTNKLESLARPLVKGSGLSHHFRFISGGDTFSTRKPDAGHILNTIAKSDGDPSRSVMIGDSINDIKAATNAGVPSIAVPFGYSDVPVETLQPTHIISHFDELTPELVLRLLKQ